MESQAVQSALHAYRLAWKNGYFRRTFTKEELEAIK